MTPYSVTHSCGFVADICNIFYFKAMYQPVSLLSCTQPSIRRLMYVALLPYLQLHSSMRYNSFRRFSRLFEQLTAVLLPLRFSLVKSISLLHFNAFTQSELHSNDAKAISDDNNHWLSNTFLYFTQSYCFSLSPLYLYTCSVTSQ